MSQQDRIVLQLRELILSGGLAPCERVLEVALAETLQASRTPVRRAIKILEGEGLLVAHGTRGYQVRQFSFRDVVNACLLYTSPSPRDATLSRMPSSA